MSNWLKYIFGIVLICIYLWYNLYNNLYKYNTKVINVLGNGKSLKNFDFTILDGETIGTCLAYRYWYKVNWFPDHYCCVDNVVVKKNVNDIKKLIIEKKCKTYLLSNSIKEVWPSIINYDNVYYVQDFISDKNNLFSQLSEYCTGSSATMYAYILGGTKINLFGIDCNYVEFLPETKLLNDGTLKIIKTPVYNPNYFIDDYQREGDIYNIPNGIKVHFPSWKIINKLLNKIEIINYNNTIILDNYFKRKEEYKNFKFNVNNYLI